MLANDVAKSDDGQPRRDERRGQLCALESPRASGTKRRRGVLAGIESISGNRKETSATLNLAFEYYKKVLQDKLIPAVRKKRPGLLESGILFHHDNAPVHTARAVTDVLAG
ncbi:hypothetical protein ElyMa_001523900 [Elysia marginata]|uniref:Tc1-like transposase DDE domain-containing protein n=1 Tax=Elysia marginata TaxID=1093978 RepID=A0AAV4J973_9GAST|nr:hypothetical protein ElyMa_001523900 [Elysia marginata]